jgi:hypothetical protein
MDESHKLDPWHLDEGPRPMTSFGGKMNWFKPQKKELKRRAHDLKNQDAS